MRRDKNKYDAEFYLFFWIINCTMTDFLIFSHCPLTLSYLSRTALDLVFLLLRQPGAVQRTNTAGTDPQWLVPQIYCAFSAAAELYAPSNEVKEGREHIFHRQGPVYTQTIHKAGSDLSTDSAFPVTNAKDFTGRASYLSFSEQFVQLLWDKDISSENDENTLLVLPTTLYKASKEWLQ